jgi:hypothetical protein
MVLVPACSDDGSGDGSGGGDGGGPVLQIVVAGDVVASWTLDELEETVSFAEIEIDGDSQSGPLLLDVLAAAGVNDWQTAEVLGKGEGRSFDVGLEMSASDVDRAWVLDVSNRGTLKLAAEDLPREKWVRDVAEIRFP